MDRQYHWHKMPICAHLNPEVSPKQTALLQQTEAQMHIRYQRKPMSHPVRESVPNAKELLRLGVGTNGYCGPWHFFAYNNACLLWC